MCISFFYLAPAEEDVSGSYALILVMNRDELLARPTEHARWLGQDPPILAGRDLTPGREGGTWLGLEKRAGKVAFLTNMYTGEPVDPRAHGRGHLIIDYFNSPQSGPEYLRTIREDNKLFNPFNLVTMDWDGSVGRYQAQYFRPTQVPLPLCPGFHGLSNHPYTQPFLKTERGLAQFQSLVTEALAGKRDQKELVTALITMMHQKERHVPDEQLKRQSGPNAKPLDCLGSIFVEGPNGEYGTRAQTVIVVNKRGQVYFQERARSADQDWSTHEYEFTIGE